MAAENDTAFYSRFLLFIAPNGVVRFRLGAEVSRQRRTTSNK
jgi:hypothetical protein